MGEQQKETKTTAEATWHESKLGLQPIAPNTIGLSAWPGPGQLANELAGPNTIFCKPAQPTCPKRNGSGQAKPGPGLIYIQL